MRTGLECQVFPREHWVTGLVMLYRTRGATGNSGLLQLYTYDVVAGDNSSKA